MSSFILQKHEKENIKTQVIVDTENTKEPEIIGSKHDSTLLKKVISAKETILQLDNLNLIIRKQFDGDCSGTDSLFYDLEYNLKVKKSFSGCSADEESDISIYDNKMLLYYESTSGGDGLSMENYKLFFDQNQAFYGFKEKYKIDYENRTIIDTIVSVLTTEELEKESKSKFSEDKNLGNIIERVSNLKVSLYYSDKVVLIDTIQKVIEERKFIIDTTIYKKLVK